MAKLTPAQQRFADEYLIDLNATRAYKAAYPSVKKDNVASAAATRLLGNVKVKEYIDEKLADMSSSKIADAKEVMEYLSSVMRREYKENVVVTLSEECSAYAPDENGTMRKQTVKRETPQIVEIPAKLSDANKAAELLGKRYSLFTDNVNLTGATPVQIINDIPKGDNDGS
ncbi:MAG: terminase small subunit [Candidatus Fimivivens sp.]|nr:terminase small subunit [Candidatus Fimivivens sp.]